MKTHRTHEQKEEEQRLLRMLDIKPPMSRGIYVGRIDKYIIHWGRNQFSDDYQSKIKGKFPYDRKGGFRE